MSISYGSDYDLKRYKPNYITPFSYNSDKDEMEVVFQISLKKLVYKPVKDLGVYFGYSQKSFWQLYDKANSSPFRETNYNPEFFLNIDVRGKFDGFTDLIFGYEHESNGQTIEKSRSWNKEYVRAFWEKGNLKADLKVWARIPEREKRDENDTQGDDNPDIEKYYGNSELNLSYKYKNSQISLFLRNLESAMEDKSYIGREVTYNYDLGNGMDLVLKYFKGYGESLIDYNNEIEKYSIGFQVY